MGQCRARGINPDLWVMVSLTLVNQDQGIADLVDAHHVGRRVATSVRLALCWWLCIGAEDLLEPL